MQQRSHSRSMAIAVLLALLAATMNGCGGAPGPATPEGITVPAPTTAATTAATETPTSPPSPTATTAPTNTPMPTDTPRPTATATEPPTPTPSATPLPISTPTPVVVVTPIGEIGTAHIGLSGADADQRVMIEGEVVRVESHSRSVKVFVKDETGEIVVFLWRTVLDRIAANTALGTPGSRVRVIGTVSVYRNNLELIPTLPNDVIVLSGE